jgi:glycerol-3-phosphate dehydrogenase
MRLHSRTETIDALSRQTLDLLVIGGGIVGARIAYEAARSGLAVAIVDAGDFGGGTSSASSKLVHGGFRYLPMGDIALVRQSQRERQVLLESVAPNLVRRLPFLLPAFRDGRKGPATIGAGLFLYSALAGRGGRVGVISPGRAGRLVPPIRTDGMSMCGVFEEAETIDARLVLATIKGAARAGALVLNHARVAGLELRHNRGGAVGVACEPEGALEIHARHVVNAAGPWVDYVRRIDDPAAPPLVRLSKGVHLLAPLDDHWEAGVAMPLAGGRVALAIPWQGMLMLGTTDTPFDGHPSDVHVTHDDFVAVLDEASSYLPPELLQPDRIRCEVAGLRALPIAEGDTAAARRGHQVEMSRYGLISVAGGKLTTHRLIAIDVLRRVRDARLAGLVPDTTRLPATGWDARMRVRPDLDPEIADHLERLYGDEAGDVVEMAREMANGLERISPEGPDVWAQAEYARRSEWACTDEDITRRRTTLTVRGLAFPPPSGGGLGWGRPEFPPPSGGRARVGAPRIPSPLWGEG